MDLSEAGFNRMVLLTNVNLSTSFDISVLIAIFFIVALLILSGLISGSEIAFFSLNPSQIKELENSEDETDKLIINHLNNPKQLLATILISNNFVNVAIVLISAWLSAKIFDFSTSPLLGFIIQVFVITGMLLLFGEIMPKIYARQKVLMFVRMMASPIKVMSRIFYPLVVLLVKSTSVIDKRLMKKKSGLSMSELSEAVDIAHSKSENEDVPEDAKILKGIATFGETEVSEIMKARVDVAAVSLDTPFNELIDKVKEWGYSRIPVYEESFDNVKGILYIKDLLSHLGEESFDWQGLIRETLFVPENKKINDLLQEFKRRKIHLAVVVDEYGGTSGIVTLEDVLEEIVGEISDEFDNKENNADFKKTSENTWVFEAKTSLNDLCKITGLDPDIFDSAKGDSDTIAGLILEITGDFPKINDIVKFKDMEFKILMMDKRRIKKVEFKKL